MFCQYCGTKNEADSRFCINCGKPLEDATEQPATQQPKEDTVTPNNSASTPHEPVVSRQAVKQQSKSKKWVPILIGGLVVLAIAVGAGFYLQKPAANTKMATSASSKQQSTQASDSESISDSEVSSSSSESVANPLWTESKKDSLQSFMADWGTEMDQDYQEYSDHHNVSLYGVDLPGDLLSGAIQTEVGGSPVTVKWSEDGVSAKADYKVVAAYSDANSGGEEDHFYLFTIHDGRPVVLIAQEGQGSTSSSIAFKETENTTLRNGFSDIIGNWKWGWQMEPRREKFSRQKNQRLGRNILVVVIGIIVIIAAGIGIAVAKNRQDQAAQSRAKQQSLVARKKAQSKAKKAAANRSQKAVKQTAKATEKPKKQPTEKALTFDTQNLTANAQKVGYGIYYYNSKRSVGSNQDQPFISASVIKLFIMDYLYDQVKQGKISGGHYIDNHSVDEWIQLMIQQSDNNATNLLIDFAGMTEINQYIQQQGYTQTKLERKMLDDAARNQGLDNYTSVKDVLQFLNQLYQNRDQAPYSKMLTIMKGQQTRTKIPSQLPANTVVANKTGELADVENDVGIVFKDNDPFAIVVLTNQVQNPAAERQAIGALSLAAFQK